MSGALNTLLHTLSKLEFSTAVRWLLSTCCFSTLVCVYTTINWCCSWVKCRIYLGQIWLLTGLHLTGSAATAAMQNAMPVFAFVIAAIFGYVCLLMELLKLNPWSLALPCPAALPRAERTCNLYSTLHPLVNIVCAEHCFLSSPHECFQVGGGTVRQAGRCG